MANKTTNQPAEAEEKAKEDAAPKVAKGKSITSKRGILGEGEPVTADDFAGGKEDYDNLKKLGFIE